jgi:hypothetical protein
VSGSEISSLSFLVVLSALLFIVVSSCGSSPSE